MVRFGFLLALMLVAAHPVMAARPTQEEQQMAKQWVTAHLASDDSLPFSFTFGGHSWREQLGRWKSERDATRLDSHRTHRTLKFTDPESGLIVRCEAVVYDDFPTVEWTLYFRNSGSVDTPVLEAIHAVDLHLAGNPSGKFVLHHHKGSRAETDDYRPLRTTLEPKSELRIAPNGGRPTDGAWPYFNLAWDKGGLILAVGWPGQWSARFTRDAADGLRITAGQQLTRFRLHPGEEVRSPLIALQFWHGDRTRSQNVWRSWMIEHNVPRVEGKLPPARLTACSSHQFNEMIDANEANQILFIDRYLAKRLPLAYWWMDAGWYTNDGTWVNTGTWEVDRQRFPHGLRAISDHAHARDVKTILWFEPERVTPGTRLYTQHADWLLKPTGLPPELGYQSSWRLLNLGNPDAWRWLVEHVDKILTEEGIDLYRQDFNMDPLSFWRSNDTDDRQGITEIRHVTGYLAYWDELLRRHPGLTIDTCASGGRRNDLETLRRSVPLLRSDRIFEPISQQCHTYGIASWVPYFGTGTRLESPGDGDAARAKNTYAFRSQMCPHLTACWDVRRKDLDDDLLRQLTRQHAEIGPYYWGDYYPLTPYRDTAESWIAWQFHRADLDAGFVQAFRRSKSSTSTMTLTLDGLQADLDYRAVSLDTGKAVILSGLQLRDRGLKIDLNRQPGAALIMYRAVGSGS